MLSDNDRELETEHLLHYSTLYKPVNWKKPHIAKLLVRNNEVENVQFVSPLARIEIIPQYVSSLEILCLNLCG